MLQNLHYLWSMSCQVILKRGVQRDKLLALSNPDTAKIRHLHEGDAHSIYPKLHVINIMVVIPYLLNIGNMNSETFVI